MNRAKLNVAWNRDEGISQNENIMAFFKSNPQGIFTASSVKRFAMPDTLRTSVYRSLSNLTKAGKLVKSESAKLRSQYGVKVSGWRLAR